MRTIFEDTEVKAELENESKGGSKTMPVVLWLIALAFLAGTWTVYRWVENRPAPEAPPPPVSLEDPKQTTSAIGKFNSLARDGKWAEAEAMLSIAARQRLATEQKTLQESLLGNFKDLKITEAATTPSVDNSIPGKLRQDCVYIFTDEKLTRTEQKIVPITLIIEEGKLAVDNWTDEQQPAPTPSPNR